MKPLDDVLWASHTRNEFTGLAEQDAVVIVPISSTEQHGLALPEDTDQRTVDFVAKQAAMRLDDLTVLVAPPILYGVSPHHMRHGGTITLSVETTLRVLKDVCQSIAAHGFERIVILSGHGGNSGIVSAAAIELKHELGIQVDGYCWFTPVQPEIDAICEGPCHTIGHAGEAEASTIMALAPELVRSDSMVLVDDISDDPSLGTAAKGEAILEAGVVNLVGHLREMASKPGRAIEGIQQA